MSNPPAPGTPLRCTECPHVFSAADVAAEDPEAWGHPCFAAGRRIKPGVTPCESYREPVPVPGTPAPEDRSFVEPAAASAAEWFNKFRPLMTDPTFTRELDGLSADVLELCASFTERNADRIFTLAPDVVQREEMFVSMVVGWVLGMPAGAAADSDRDRVGMEHITLAAYVSAFSRENSRRVCSPKRN